MSTYPALTLYHRLIRNKTFHRVLVIIQFEPSWIGEFVNALAMAGWGAGMLFSNDFGPWTFGTWIMPVMGIIGLLLRLYALVKIGSALRAIMAISGVVWWAVLTHQVYIHDGFIGGLGAYSALMLGDFFTLMKFTTAAQYYTELERHSKQG